MKLIITINQDNDAFQGSSGIRETQRILRELSVKHGDGCRSCVIHDSNGNKVGHMATIKDN